MKCAVCGKTTLMKDSAGYWQPWDCGRKWVCRECQFNGRYQRERPDDRDYCCVHGKPCIQGTRCEQCIKEGR